MQNILSNTMLDKEILMPKEILSEKEQKQRKIDIFEKYPIPKAMITLCVPTLLGMIATIIYNMVDTFFVGKTGDPAQVAAVGLSAPILMYMMALGNVFGLGGGSYIARMLGKHDYDEVLRTSSFSFYGCVVFSIVFGIVGLLFLDPILNSIGTSPQTYEHTRSYLFYLFLGTPAMCLPITLSNVVRAEGAAKHSMIGIMIGTFTNIILDPIMIFSMNMGVAGAAVATVIGNLLAALYFIYYLIKKTSFLTIAYNYFSTKKEVLRNVFFVGTPISINNIIMAFSFMVLNNFVAPYGDNAIAGASVSSRVFSVVIMLFVGVSQGLQPFVSYNYSSENYKRMNAAIKFTLTVCVILGAVLTIFNISLSDKLIAIFIAEENVIYYGKMFLDACSTICVFVAVQFIIAGIFQAMGKPKQAFFIMISRQGLVFIPVLIIFDRVFQLQGVVWAQPMADAISAIISIILYVVTYQRIKKQKEITLQLEANNIISTAIAEQNN